MKKTTLIKLFSLLFTLIGLGLLISGNLTDGFLSLILGELIDIPKINS